MTTGWLAILGAVAIADPCVGIGTALYVDAGRHMLYVCESGRQKAAHRVALGSGGLGKRHQGDAKVPLGSYSLGTPRGSASFHVFIPVGYPTQEQRRAGFTGGDVGVHGPARAARGAFSTLVDWTLGCIAVGTDEEIDSVAAWVRRQRPSQIVIRAN
jgi:murein L,D-transpeptidase YafK